MWQECKEQRQLGAQALLRSDGEFTVMGEGHEDQLGHRQRALGLGNRRVATNNNCFNLKAFLANLYLDGWHL